MTPHPCTPLRRAGILCPRKRDGIMRKPIASVVVPAHNEAAVLGRCLDALQTGVEPGQLEVVVACNGCTDHTATVARDRGAAVVEIDAASKFAALIAGDAAATVFPRCYVDADAAVTGAVVVQVAELLARPGIHCAAPPIQVELTGRSWPIRAYYAVWLRVPYMSDQMVGNGFYAMSAWGRQQFDRFPKIVRLLTDARHQPPADDLFARNLFSREQRRNGPAEPFVIRAPRSLRVLLRRRIRMERANRELIAHPDYRTLPGVREGLAPGWWRNIISAGPWLIPNVLVYTAIELTAMVAARWQLHRTRSVAWGRDHTTRSTTNR